MSRVEQFKRRIEAHDDSSARMTVSGLELSFPQRDANQVNLTLGGMPSAADLARSSALYDLICQMPGSSAECSAYLNVRLIRMLDLSIC